MSFPVLKPIILSFVFYFFWMMTGNAQQPEKRDFLLKIERADSAFQTPIPPLQSHFTSLSERNKYVESLPQLMKNKGYIALSIDSSWERKDTLYLLLYTGKKYKWDNLAIRSKDSILLTELGYSAPSKQSLNPESLQKMQESILDYYNKIGYPFATVRIDSIQMEEELLSGNLTIDRGGYYRLDTIINNGNAKITPNFLQRYLEIPTHSPYNSEKLSSLTSKLNNLAYVQQAQSWNVRMTNTGAILNLYLEPKKVNQIDAIVGFLPENGSAGGKLLLTGQVNLDLKNSFAAGEEIKFSWQQLQSQSPRLNLGFNRPYIFNSPYGIDFDFELYKKDSSFMNTFAKLGVSYAISSKQTGSMFVQFASSRLLNVDTAAILSTKTLPSIRDIGSTSIGIQYYLNSTNYRLNPRRGTEISMYLLAGNRKEGKNNTIVQLRTDSFDYSQLYDTVKLNSYQFKAVVSASHYIPIGKQAVLKSAVSGGFFQSPTAYINELFQIGGYKLLRGFDEESIYANKYVVATAEYRYLIGQNAYFFGFGDGGWTNYNVTGTKYNHTYIGVGIGMAFQTKSGLLNLSYAVGKRDDTKFDMQQAKIHIGFVSVF